MGRDYLGIVEAAYGAAATEADWLRAIALAAAPAVDEGLGAWAVRFDARKGIELPVVANAGVPPELWRGLAEMRRVLTPAQVRLVYGTDPPVTTMSWLLRGIDLSSELWERHIFCHGAKSLLAIRAGDPSRTGVVIGVPLTRSNLGPGPRTRAALAAVARHLSAAWKVKKEGAESWTNAVALLGARGKIAHLAAGPVPPGLRPLLARAAGARAQANVEGGPLRAFALRDEIVGQRWSVVERIDSDGKVFLVVRRAPAGTLDPTRLSDRERRVARSAASGQTNKAIAADLGVSSVTVAEHLARAMRKLHLLTRGELAAFFAPAPQPFVTRV